MRGLVVVLLAVLAVGGCGGGGKKGIGDPSREALAYVPADAALVAVVSTDLEAGPGAALKELADRFPASRLALAQAAVMLEPRIGVSLDELAPLVGNDLVLYAVAGGASRRHEMPSVAWVVEDADRLTQVFEDDPQLRATGTYRDAKLFAGPGGTAFAVRGEVLLAGPTARAVHEALDRRASAEPKLTPGKFAASLRPLSTAGAIVRVGGDAQALVARGHRRFARIPYVRALRRFAATLSPERGGVRGRLHVAVDPTEITPDDMPLATGVQPPAARGRAPLVAGIRDLAHTLTFLRRAARTVAPKLIAELDDVDDALRRFARVDLQEQVVGGLTGSATITSDEDLRTFTLRAEAANPDAIQAALERIARLAKLSPVAELAGVDLGGYEVDDAGEDRYVIKRDGRTLATAGVWNGALVVSTDPAVDVRAIGNAPPPGRLAPAKGAFRATVAAAAIKRLIVERLRLPRLVALALAPLGDLTLTAHAESASLDGEALLAIE